MMTVKFSKEALSGAVDGHASVAEFDALLAQAGDADLQHAWMEMHQVGELINSDDGAVRFSAGFNQRLFARLDLEPTHSGVGIQSVTAPNVVAINNRAAGAGKLTRPANLRRLWAPGVAAAGVAAVVALWGGQALMVASVKPDVPATARSADVVPVDAMAANSAAPQILRDPKVDAYLRAHGQPSAAEMGSADFARATDYSVPVASGKAGKSDKEKTAER